MLKYFLLWFPMPVIAIINATLRELLFVKNFGQKTAHQLSTITIIIFLAVYIYIISSKWNFPYAAQAVWTGIIWCALTLAFEFGLGFAANKTFSEMLKAYDLLSGELWILVPFFLLIAPVIFYYFFQR